MSTIVLSVEKRESTGTGPARAVRREGLVPGVLYGGSLGPVSISLQLNELKKAINRGGLRSHMIQIDNKGETQSVLVRDIQFDPISDVPVHLDLYRVEMDQIISVEVPVHFLNEAASPGLKRGGTLNIVRHAVELDCPAGAIPEEITVDLTGLDIGDSVHISSVSLPANVTPTITDRDFTIATIAGAGGPEPEEEAAPEAVETEVIKTKGKAEEEEEGGGEKGEKKS
jgi:large subunit ribosomal protein L25